MTEVGHRGPLPGLLAVGGGGVEQRLFEPGPELDEAGIPPARRRAGPGVEAVHQFDEGRRREFHGRSGYGAARPPAATVLLLKSLIDWLFRNRQTGRITIAQAPNLALWLFIVAAVLRSLLDPSGGVRTALDGVATVALAWWAVDEIVRGVNPWRRLLGGAVLAGQVLKYLR